MNGSIRFGIALGFAILVGSFAMGQTAAEFGRGVDWAAAPWNRSILRIVDRMPVGGGYATNAKALDRLQLAVVADRKGLRVNPTNATPSFCSSATYIVFSALFDELVAAGRIRHGADALSRLAVMRQKDGVGVWGRWNANGPGVARLFSETGMGINFESMEHAIPGDFMKIFWTEEIGAKEFGHLVIFLGHRKVASGERMVTFWSSNQPGGYGRKEVPESKIKWVVFSRLMHPEKFIRLPEPDSLDRGLADMLKRSFSKDEVRRMVGMTAPATLQSSAAAAGNRPAPPTPPTVEKRAPPVSTPSSGLKTNTGEILIEPRIHIPETPPRKALQHVVKPGETLSGIAERYGTTVQAICTVNHLVSPDRVRAGQMLTLPQQDLPTASQPQSGDPSFRQNP